MLPVQRQRKQRLQSGNGRPRRGCTDHSSPGNVPLMIPIPQRVLLGPGPSDVPPRVLEAIAHPTIGHLDPVFLQLMDDVRQKLKLVFRTTNEMTLAVSGTGSAGMECLF